MYGCAAWTLTISQERLLTTTQRRMMRWIVGVPKHESEDWPDYIKRSTHASQDLFTKHGATEWVSLFRATKWKFAGQCCRQADARWNRKLLEWKPWFRTTPYRAVGHPHLRWDDGFVAICGGDWIQAAKDETLWSILAERYANKAVSD